MNTSGILTISVNPAESTIGSLHPEACVNRMRRKVDLEGANLARRKSGSLLRAFFGATSVVPSISVAMLIARIACSGYMIYSGVEALSVSLIESVIAFSMAAILMLGVGTRCLLGAAALGFGLMAGMLIDAGLMPVEMLVISGISLIWAIVGPGRYSMDAVLRRKIFRAIRRHETHKLMENRFSYRAYQIATEF